MDKDKIAKIICLFITLCFVLFNCATNTEAVCMNGYSVIDTISDSTFCLIEKLNDKIQINYVINLNSKKFHYADCPSVDRMSEWNKEYYTGNRYDIIENGYVPCKRCNP